MTAVDPAPGRGVVLYDGDCAFCRKCVAIFRKLDWLGRLAYQNARETDKLPPCGEPLVEAKMLDEMHVVPPSRAYSLAGFRAVRWMFWRMPPTMPVAPFLYIPGVPWLGARAYRWVARNRFKLVPCDDGGCKVPLVQKK